MLAIICLATICVLAGCKKKEQPPSLPKTSMEAMTHDVNQAQLASIVQKNCPITGQPIDPNVFIEYKGKKVYFCCSACIADFNKNPEKFISKLPQFSKK